MDLKRVKIDLDSEVGGVWHTVDDLTEIKVARYNNPVFQKEMQAAAEDLPTIPKALQNVVDLDKSPEYEDKLNRLIASTILVDWRGMFDDGEELPYSEDAAYTVLSDPKLKDFREYVLKLSMNASYYREQSIKETAVN